MKKRDAGLFPALALLLLLLALPGCKPETESPAPVVRTDTPVFVISIDTLRSDRLPLYGYARGRTPAIDAFRNDAILFRKAFSNIPLTLPSHTSIFTGALPHEHGVRDNIGYTLSPDTVTLASRLAADGYATGAAVSSFVLRGADNSEWGETGLSTGFSFYDDLMDIEPQEAESSWQRNGDTTRVVLEEWLSTVAGTRVFGFLHLYEPHTPYTPPEPWLSAFEEPYDGEIAYADAIVGRFLDTLRQRGLYDKSLIVVLSDHGEGLGDHGEREHGVFLYRESIQVPLLIKLPDSLRAGEEYQDVVSLTDLMPTILGVVGIASPDDIDGVDLISEPVTEGRSVYSESYYPRLHFGWSELHSVVDSRLHYIDAPSAELFDYLEDPGESSNLAEENRRLVATRRDAIEAIVEAHPFKEPAPVDPEDIRKLEALGYLGSSAPPPSGARPDPKEMVEVLEQFGTASGYLQSDDFDKAIEVGEAIVRENPAFLQGWGLLSSAYRSKGDLPAALAAMREQMKRSPGSNQTALAMASLLLDSKRYDEAREHAELVVDDSPSLAHEMMASIALAKGDLAQAEIEARKSADAAPLRVKPLMILSQVRNTEKKYAEELALLDQVHAQVEAGRVSPIRELEYRRGGALLQLGRRLEAEQAFRTETELFPDHRMAWVNLSLVVGGQRRTEEARTILRSALEAIPNDSMRRGAREALQIMGDTEGLRQLGLD